MIRLMFAWFCLTPMLLGQNAQQPVEAAPANYPVAIVLGRVITKNDMLKVVSQLREQFPQENPESLFYIARFETGKNALIVETAKIYSETVTDEEVISSYANFRGMTEKEVEENLEYYRNSYLVEVYIACRKGLSKRLPGVSPDLASTTHIRPHEMRSFYKYNVLKPLQDKPAKKKMALFQFSLNAAMDVGLLNANLEECRKKLLAGPKQGELKDLSKLWDGCFFLEADNTKSLAKEILDFAKTAKKGDVSQPIPLGERKALVYIYDVEKEPIPTFEQCQLKIRDELRKRKNFFVQKIITMELIDSADYFPDDLFSQQRAGSQGRRGP